jgi:hypothetical protein
MSIVDPNVWNVKQWKNEIQHVYVNLENTNFLRHKVQWPHKTLVNCTSLKLKTWAHQKVTLREYKSKSCFRRK